jgi:hypothetical protein
MNPRYNVATVLLGRRTRLGNVTGMWKSGLLLMLFLLLPVAVWGKKDETLDQLKERANAAQGGERVKLCLEVAQRQLAAADKLYTDGKVDDAAAAVKDIASYSEMAGDTAVESGKKLKDAEISVRKISQRLGDIKRTLNFDDQQPVQDIVDRLERVRTNLLTKMFGAKKQ